MTTYKTILEPSEAIIKEKGSKFISIAFHIEKEGDFKEKLKEIKEHYHDARHYCYAYRVGITSVTERLNDDGEPSGTAGLPILRQIHSFGLTNIGIIVVRYFGGIKLGVSGLINAYKQAALQSLSKAKIVEKELKDIYLITFEYDIMGNVLVFLKKNKVEYFDIKMEEKCSIKIALPYSDKTFFEKIGNLKLNIKHLKIK